MRIYYSAVAFSGQMVAFAALITFLTACSHDTRVADINQCIAEVQKEASHGQLNYLLGPADNAEDRHDKIGGMVSDCMAKLGYRHRDSDMADNRCLNDVDFNPYCYRRAG